MCALIAILTLSVISFAVVLMHTSLTGKIPREFARLTKLEYLYLNDNRLALDTVEGDLDFVKDLTSLTNLHLENNADIVGTFPDAVSDMTNLGVLALYNTGLYGTIPPSLSKLTKLRGLQLGSCDFEGSIEVINGMPSLTHVYLENNRFNDTMDEAFFGGLDKSWCIWIFPTVPLAACFLDISSRSQS